MRLRPTHWRVPAGHALRLSVSSGDVPDAIPDAPAGTVSIVAGGTGGSYADVPLLHGASLKLLGSGWLEDAAGKHISFTLDIRQSGSAPSGELQLHDARANARIWISEVLSVTGATEACGRTRAGARAFEVNGRGSYNGQPATFRACAIDGGEGGGDALAVACTSACSYDSRTHSLDDRVVRGNISANQTTPFADAGATAGPEVLLLQPGPAQPLLASAAAPLAVRVLDAHGQPIAGISVALQAAGGLATSLISDVNGLALFTVAAPPGAEFWAVSGGLASNSAQAAP